MTSASIYVAPRAGPWLPTWAALASAALQWSCIVAFVAQLVIDPADANIVAATCALASSTLVLQYLRRTEAFVALPLSSFAVLGFCMTTQWGALVVQSAAWTPIAENLRDPVRTFLLLGLFQCVAILAHLVHRNLGLAVKLREIGANALGRLGVFEVPAPGSLWLMGAGGFAAYAIAAAPGEVDLGDRLLAGFWPFAWAPFLIPILRLRYGSAYCALRLHGIALLLYLLMAFALAMALNYRGLMLQGATTAALLSFLLILQTGQRVNARALLALVPLALIAMAATWRVADLATAMAIARTDRGHVSPIELLKETIDVLQDPNAVRQYRERDLNGSRLSAYDETYIANSMLARFVETKFYDNSLYFSKDLTDWERGGLEQEVVDRLWSMLPYPVLRALDIPVDKNVLSHSLGDYYANLRSGVPLDGLKTGAMEADLVALFEEAAPVVYFSLCLALFLFWDALSFVHGPNNVQVSVLAMLQVYRLFTYGATNESVTGALALFLRGFWQNLAFYLLTYSIAKIVFPPFRSSNR